MRKGCSAVIVAAGTAQRMRGIDKIMTPIGGIPLLLRTLRALAASEKITDFIIVTRKELMQEVKELCQRDAKGLCAVVEGGSSRAESVLRGLEAVRTELVAIHDGARPLVTPDLINRSINMLKGDLDIDGVVVGHPSVDTLKVVDSANIVGTPDRNMFWIAQTPQVFRSTILRRAYSAAMFEGFVGTDDSSLVERMGGVVHMVNGPRDNIKVTVPEDIGPAIAALAARLELGE